jgi:hypothetical protein
MSQRDGGVTRSSSLEGMGRSDGGFHKKSEVARGGGVGRAVVPAGRLRVWGGFWIPIWGCGVRLTAARLYEKPSGSVTTVNLPRCACAVPRGPVGGVCGACGNAIYTETEKGFGSRGGA